MEGSVSGAGCRPTVNAQMYAEAIAIAEIARLAGNETLAATFTLRARWLRETYLELLCVASSPASTASMHEFMAPQYVHSLILASYANAFKASLLLLTMCDTCFTLFILILVCVFLHTDVRTFPDVFLCVRLKVEPKHKLFCCLQDQSPQQRSLGMQLHWQSNLQCVAPDSFFFCMLLCC